MPAEVLRLAKEEVAAGRAKSLSAFVAEAVDEKALRAGVRLIIPAGVLGRVWRGAARQAPLRALLKGPTTEVPALDQVLAEAASVLCARTGTSDVIDASVVLAARRAGAVVVTSDLEDITRLDGALPVERI